MGGHISQKHNLLRHGMKSVEKSAYSLKDDINMIVKNYMKIITLIPPYNPLTSW